MKCQSEEDEEEKKKIAVDLLMRFGLSKDEAALFTVLVQANKEKANWLKGSELSSLAEKGRVRTYQILQRLTQLGLVKVDFSRPKRYSAVSPQIAVRRLLANQESKLTQLSHLEEQAVGTLLDLSPVKFETILRKPESNNGSNISLLHGIANIQVALREIVDDAELYAVVNKESIDHILTTTSLVAKRPKSLHLVFASATDALSREYGSIIKENNFAVLRYRRDIPTFLLTQSRVVFLQYAIQEEEEEGERNRMMEKMCPQDSPKQFHRKL